MVRVQVPSDPPKGYGSDMNHEEILQEIIAEVGLARLLESLSNVVDGIETNSTAIEISKELRVLAEMAARE